MKLVKILCCFLLLLTAVFALPGSSILAQEEGEGEEEPTEPVEALVVIAVPYPKVEVSNGEAAFDLDLTYVAGLGSVPLAFDLVATGPQDWLIYMTPNFPKDKRIVSIELEGPNYSGFDTKKIRLVAVPPMFTQPDAGDFPITLEVRSGDLSNSYVLNAVIPATYYLNMAPTAGIYSAKATAGRDNFFSIDLMSIGSAPVTDITMSASKPEGWTITFSPTEVASLRSGGSQTVEINITPPARSIAGDYIIPIKAESGQTSAEVNLRVTVETPTVWGWVGVGLIVLVITGVGYIFMRFSRR